MVRVVIIGHRAYPFALRVLRFLGFGAAVDLAALPILPLPDRAWAANAALAATCFGVTTRSGVGQCVVGGVVDEIAAASDAGGEGHQLRDTGVRGPRQPFGQQLLSLAAFDPEQLAQLLFEQIRPVEHLVGGGDLAKAGARCWVSDRAGFCAPPTWRAGQ